MTDYVKSTNFASKDSLAIGNPLKIVKGTEIDAEFNNISTAVATKADLNSPAFIGSPTAPTPASGNSTTLLATTAFVTSAITTAIAAARSALLPVGSIYTNATDNTNPATLLGFGTWVAFGTGRVPVGFDGSDALFNAAEKTGGSKDAVLVSHNHTFSASASTGSAGSHNHSINDPGHQHPLQMGAFFNGPYNTFQPTVQSENFTLNTNTATTGISLNGVGDHAHSVSVSGSTSTNGSSATNANVQPYITVYMWKRTA